MTPPDRWWRDADAIQAELAEHGTLAAAARAHGIKPNTVVSGWNALGLPALPKGATAQRRLVPGAAVSEEEILRQRITELEQAASKGRDRDVFEERLLRAIQQSCQTKAPSYKAAPLRKSQKDAHEFVLLWSDTHAAEVVSREETNGLNEYDWQIMLRRHDRIREAVLSFAANRPYPIERLHVFALGDMLSGNIHEELSETNEFPLAEATVQAGLDFAEWLESFVPHFNEIRFAGVVGNHPRAHRKPQAKRKFDNADWTMYQIMRQRLRRVDSISWEIPKAQKWPVEVAGKRFLLWHGDGVRSTMPGVPWGGVMRRVASMQNEYAAAGMPIDYFVNGHFHQGAVVQGGRIVMNPSVKGVDEFSLHQFGGGEGPRQTLLTLHPRRGLTDVSLIDLDES